MTDRRLTAVIVLLASGISAVATSFAIYATSQRFLVSSFNHLILEYLPGWFVSSVIQRFGDIALELSLLFSGVLLSVVIGAIALAGYWLGLRAVSAVVPSGGRIAGIGLSTVLVFIVAVLVVGELRAAIAPAVVGGAVIGLFAWLSVMESQTDGDAATGIDPARRTLVTSLVAVAVYNVVAHVIGLVRRDQTQRAERELQQRAERVGAEQLVSDAEDAGLEAEGLKPLVSEIGEFYVVDINPSPPTIDASAWSLSITGLVEDELELGYDEIRQEEIVNRYKAIRCLSDDIDGEQLDTAVWTGVSLADVIDTAGPEGEYAMLYGADDYFYSIPLEDLEDSLLAFGMNGLELPAQHGYPVRVLVPDRWGKLHVKWLTEIEIIDAEEGGYWEERGWNGMGPVNAVTKVDRINRLDDGIQIVGHAYAGARGVETVEVSLDGGDSWDEAMLSEPLPDPDTTRQWMYEFDPADRDGDSPYEMYARTIDGEGTVQPEERADPFPDGATGWAHRTVRTQ